MCCVLCVDECRVLVSVGCCVLWCLLCVGAVLLFVVWCMPSVAYCMLLAVFDACGLLYGVRCFLFGVCCLFKLNAVG